jgi:hypothetical protein
MEHRAGTVVVAGALKVIAVLIVAGAVVGVALFRTELLELVPFVGAKGAATPAVFTVLVAAVALLFWGVADALGLLVAHVEAHARLGAVPVATIASSPLPAPVVVPRIDESGGVGDVPGFRRYQRPTPRVLKWIANVTNGPGYVAATVCEVASGEMVTAIGEVKEFVFVEATGGNGWLPKDSLADLAASF